MSGTTIKTLGVVGLLLLVGGMSVSTGAQGGASQDGLVAYWALDDGQGTVVKDGSGRGHDGTLKNDPQWEKGRVGGGLRFDGLDDVVEVPHHEDFNVQNGVTLLGWFFISSEPDTGPGNDWRLMIGRNGFKPYGLLLEQSRRLSGSVDINKERQLVRSTVQLPIGEWVHVAYTYDGATGVSRIYINGQLDVEETLARGPIDITENIVRISLPKAMNPVNVEEFHAWLGLIDEVRMYGRTLSAGEVQAIYESEKSKS